MCTDFPTDVTWMSTRCVVESLANHLIAVYHPGYHRNAATHALVRMMYGSSCAQVHKLPQNQYGDNREGTLFS